MKVMAFDPGGSTGWCKLNIEIKNNALDWKKPLWQHFQCGQLSATTEHHLALWTLLAKERPNIIICERFDNRGNDFAKLVSREYIGVIKLYSAAHGVYLVMQGADQAKKFSTNGKLASLGILATPVSTWPHANDAYRHLVYYLATKGVAEFPSIRVIVLECLKEA